MNTRLKRLLISCLREKTGWPVVFLLAASLTNLIIVSDFHPVEKKLLITTAKAFSTITDSSVGGASANAADEQYISGLYQEFLKNNFIVPTTGKNQGRLHGNNGVDISDKCGKTIYAAKEGLVVAVASDNSWNGGYGNFVVIEHPNGVQTKYAHDKKNLVVKGAYVLQGDPIALIGNTGFVQGLTGCHLHFEVIGGANPFGKE